jgi:hypothetical protein
MNPLIFLAGFAPSQDHLHLAEMSELLQPTTKQTAGAANARVDTISTQLTDTT